MTYFTLGRWGSFMLLSRTLIQTIPDQLSGEFTLCDLKFD